LSVPPVAPVDMTVHLYAYGNILMYYSIAAVLTIGGETFVVNTSVESMHDTPQLPAHLPPIILFVPLDPLCLTNNSIVIPPTHLLAPISVEILTSAY